MVGQRWAYRGKQTEPVTCVEVKRLGAGRPPRVLIKFVDDEFEGREEWAPPGRLKVLWANVDAWRANEQRWKNLRDESDHIRDTPEDHALWMVIDNLREWDLARAHPGPHPSIRARSIPPNLCPWRSTGWCSRSPQPHTDSECLSHFGSWFRASGPAGCTTEHAH